MTDTAPCGPDGQRSTLNRPSPRDREQKPDTAPDLSQAATRWQRTRRVAYGLGWCGWFGVRSVLGVIGAAVAGLLLVVPMVVLGLLLLSMERPLSLKPLMSDVEAALARALPELVIQFDNLVFQWGGLGEPLELVANQVAIAGPNGTPLGDVTQLGIQLDLSGLLVGAIRPDRVVVRSPRLAVAWRDGTLRLVNGTPLSALMPPMTEPAAALPVLELTDGALRIDDEDRGETLFGREIDVELTPGVAGALRVKGGATLDWRALTQRVGVRADIAAGVATLQGRLFLPGIDVPAVLAAAGVEAAQISPDARMDITAETRFADGKVQTVTLNADLQAPTSLALPALLPAEQHRLEAASAVVRYDAAAAELSLESMQLKMADGIGATAAGMLITDGPAAGDVTVEAQLTDVTAERLGAYWPTTVAPFPRRWILGNLDTARVPTSRFALSGHWPWLPARLAAAEAVPTAAGDDTSASSLPPLAQVRLDSLDGEFPVEDATAHYLRPLPPITDASGTVSISKTTLTADITAGNIGALAASTGQVVIDNIHRPTEETIVIDVTGAGPAVDALRVLNNPRLGFVDALGLTPEQFSGDAWGRVRFVFPLLLDLTIRDVAVAATVKLTDAAARDIVPGIDAVQGSYDLQVDGVGLRLSGQGISRDVPFQVQWTERFQAATGQEQRRVTVMAATDEADRRRFEVELAPYFTGPIRVTLNYRDDQGQGDRVILATDMTDTEITFPEIAWDKPSGVPAQMSGWLAFDGPDISGLDDFTFEAADLVTQGRLTLASAGGLRTLKLSRLQWYGGDMAADLVFADDGTTTGLMSGSRYDLGAQTIRARPPGTPVPTMGETIAATLDGSLWATLPPHDILLSFGEVLLEEGMSVTDLDARAVRQAGRFTLLSGTGRLNGAVPMSWSVNTTGDLRRVAFNSPDMGGLLQAFAITEAVRGGDITVEAVERAVTPGIPQFDASLEVGPYGVVDAPLMARLISTLNPTEVGSDRGLHFSRLRSRVSLAGPLLTIHSLSTDGGNLGLTVAGNTQLVTGVLDLKGNIVPLRAVNELFDQTLGRIPLIGGLLHDEQGAGLLATNFSARGPFDDLALVVNPLSALAPGAFRDLFGIGGARIGAPPPLPSKKDER